VSAVRWVLLRLLAPMLDRFLWAHDELAGRDDALERRLHDVQQRLDRLTEETAAANALAWDQMALARRLAAIEERLDGLPAPEGAAAAERSA
jgi:hypothetical protein